jgi:integrase
VPLKLVRRGDNPNFYLRGSVRGIRVFETTGTDNREAAEAIRIRREAETLNRSIFGTDATITFAEAAASYLENGGEAIFLGRENPETGKWSGLIGYFMTTPLRSIGQVQADEAARKLFPGTAAATRKRQAYTPLIAVLNHAAARSWVHPPRIVSPKVKEKPPKWATPKYVQTLLPHCSPRLRLFVVVSVYTGARLAEVMRLDWDGDVDLKARQLTFRRTKNGKMRTAHIPEPLLVALATVPESDRHGPVFAWSHKAHVRRPLMNACKRAGLEYLTPHQLGRHTYATWLRIYAKRDLKGLQVDGGWDSIASVARYAHVVPGETANAVDLLPGVQSADTAGVKPRKDRRIRKKLA